MKLIRPWLAFLVALWPGLAAFAAHISITNLVTDDQTENSAQIEDSALRNAWGVSHGGNSPFWVSDNGSGVSTIYTVNGANDTVSKASLTVTIPGEGNVTGQAFNGSGAFNQDPFLFVSEDGTISGWRFGLGTSAEVLKTGSESNVYKGVALGSVGAMSTCMRRTSGQAAAA